MLHACFTPISICFVYTSLHFYAFSRTNLLTRCHSATVPVPCFLLFCISEKLYRKYSRNWTKQKLKSIFYRNEDRVQRGEEDRAARPPHGAARVWPAPRGGLAPLWLLFVSPSDFVFVTVKYWLRLLFRPIPRIFPVQLFWNTKIAENRELALWHLVNRLVPENV